MNGSITEIAMDGTRFILNMTLDRETHKYTGVAVDPETGQEICSISNAGMMQVVNMACLMVALQKTIKTRADQYPRLQSGDVARSLGLAFQVFTETLEARDWALED